MRSDEDVENGGVAEPGASPMSATTKFYPPVGRDFAVAEQPGRLQKTSDLVNDVADELRGLMERFNQRLTLNDPRLIERYINAEIHLLIHFRVREIDEEFVACFQRARPAGRPDVEIHDREDAPLHWIAFGQPV